VATYETVLDFRKYPEKYFGVTGHDVCLSQTDSEKKYYVYRERKINLSLMF